MVPYRRPPLARCTAGSARNILIRETATADATAQPEKRDKMAAHETCVQSRPHENVMPQNTHSSSFRRFAYRKSSGLSCILPVSSLVD